MRLVICITLLLTWGSIMQLNAMSMGSVYLYESDTGLTFRIYQDIYDTGQYEFAPESIIHSSLMATLFPATIARVFNFDPALFFQYWNLYFIVLLPVAVFLLAKKYYSYSLSFCAGMLITAQFYFWYGLQLARINMALLFFTLGLLALVYIEKPWKNVLLLLSAILIVISHYGTAFVVAGILIFSWIVGQLHESKLIHNPSHIFYGLSTVLLSWVFYSIYYVGPLHYVKRIILDSLLITIPEETVEWITGALFFNLDRLMSTNTFWWYFISCWFIFWITFIIIVWGLILSRSDKATLVYLGVASLLLFPLALLVPGISSGYGIIRIYYTILIILSLFFIEGTKDLSERLQLPEWSIAAFLILTNNFVITVI